MSVIGDVNVVQTPVNGIQSQFVALRSVCMEEHGREAIMIRDDDSEARFLENTIRSDKGNVF